MKITDSDLIKDCERELIDAVTADLDWDSIEKIFKQQHSMNIRDDVEYKQGDIVVHNNQIAYKLDFQVKVTLSVMFDREGNYLSLVTSEDVDQTKSTPDESNEISESGSVPDDIEKLEAPPASDPIPEVSADTEDSFTEKEKKIEENIIDTEQFSNSPTPDPEKNRDENITQMAAKIADMITEINEE